MTDRLCINENDYNPAIHNIIGGPYNSPEECSVNCQETTTTTTTTTLPPTTTTTSTTSTTTTTSTTSTTTTTSTTSTTTTTSTTSTTTTPTPTSCNFDGQGVFDMRGFCGKIYKGTFTQTGPYTWTGVLPLGCGNNSITGTISCNPAVSISQPSVEDCASKWSASISSTCGSLSLGINDGNCSNDTPPYWPISGNLDNCPDPLTCCPECYCVGVDIYPLDEEDQHGCGLIQDPVFCGLNYDEVWNTASAATIQLQAQYPLCDVTLNAAAAYFCDGICQHEPCQQ